MRYEWHGRELHLVLSEGEVNDVIEREQAIEMDVRELGVDAVLEELTLADAPSTPNLAALAERQKGRLHEVGRQALLAAAASNPRSEEEFRERALEYMDAHLPFQNDAEELVLQAISERMLTEATGGS